MVYPELMEVIYPEPVEGQYIFFSVQMDSITWGSTTNIARRLDEHLLADEAQYRGAKFTKAHQPVKLVYTEEYENEHEARMREQQLHGWSRAKKEALIRGDIETLKQLSKEKDLS